jgi:parallel beta-helix repeat protein
VEHNDAFQDAGTIVLVSSQQVLVQHNRIRNTTSSGVFVGGAVSDSTIRYNLIDSPGGTGITTNIQFVAVPNTGLRIERNHVRGSPFDGIRLNRTINSTLAGNHSERNTRDGIRLQNDSNSNQVRDNHSHDNGRDGLRVDFGQTLPNTIERNKMLGNTEHDCHDDTMGGGSGGTANFWINDIGRTQNRPGLCKNAGVV